MDRLCRALQQRADRPRARQALASTCTRCSRPRDRGRRGRWRGRPPDFPAPCDGRPLHPVRRRPAARRRTRNRRRGGRAARPPTGPCPPSGAPRCPSSRTTGERLEAPTPRSMRAALGRCDGDVRELLGIGVRDDSAVAVDQLAAVRQDHQEAGGDEALAAGRTDRRERDPNRLGRGHLRSHDRAVDLAGRRHQSGEVDRPRGQLGGRLGVFEPGREPGDELLAAARGRGVDDLESRGIQPSALERRDDRRALAHQDRPADPLGLGAGGRRQDPRVRRFGERDARRRPGREADPEPRYRIQETFKPLPRRSSTLPPRLRRSCNRASTRRR